jgi:hypothetical protein
VTSVRHGGEVVAAAWFDDEVAGGLASSGAIAAPR